MAASTVAQLIYTAVAARSFTPSDFGAYAIAISTVQVATYFVGSGVSQAILQSPDSDQDVAGLAVRQVLISGTAIGLLLTLLATNIEIIWNIDGLSQMMLIAVGIPLCAGISSISMSILRRRGQFKAASLRETLGLVVSFAMTLALISAGAPAYILVVGSLAFPVFVALLGWWALKLFPIPSGAVTSRQFLRVSYQIGMQNLVHYAILTLPLWLLGRIARASDVGLFSRAQNVSTIPMNSLSAAFTKVVYPKLAAMGRHGRDLTDPITGVIGIASIIGSACFGVIAGSAQPLIAILLGSQWADADGLLTLWTIFCTINLCYIAASSALESQALFGQIWRVQLIGGASLVLTLTVAVLRFPTTEGVLACATVALGASHADQLRRLKNARMINIRRAMNSYLQGTATYIAAWGSGAVVANIMGGPTSAIALPLTLVASLAAVIGICAVCWRTRTSRIAMGVLRELGRSRKVAPS
ncbi:oligosaccharide flippase family protein [Rhodococcus wratislaviensis]|nr:oligosaccharide flippase family protein [Rhodococcus sp. 3A]MBC2892547.1 oligosaccharide flippase family protein [Rhodococcus sp. 4CII]